MLAALIAAAGALACTRGSGDEVPPRALEPGDPARGAQAFSGMCAECHGLEAEGIAQMGMDLRSNTFIRGASIPEIIQFVRNGHAPTARFPEGMPEDGGDSSLTGQQLVDIAAWLKSLNGARQTPRSERDPASPASPAR